MGRPRLDFGTYGEIRVRYLTRTGTYEARATHRDHVGRYSEPSATGRSKTAAKTALRRKIQDVFGDGEGEWTQRTHVTEAMEAHFIDLQARISAGSASPGSMRTYRSVWDNHVKPIVGAWQLGECTTQRLDRAMTAIKEAAGLNVAKLARALLTAAMAEAVRAEVLTHNPMREVRATPRPPKKEPKALEPEQVVDLLVALEEDDRARRRELPDIVLWMLATSERIGNALAPRWFRIDLDAPTADIGPNVIRVPKEGLVIRGEFDDVSTKTRSRTVSLPDTAVRMLRARLFSDHTDVDGLDLDGRHRLADRPRQGLVFPNARGTGPLDPSNVSNALKQALHDTGYEWVTSHVFRKTVASTLDEASITPRAISDRLGHAHTSITQDDYMRRRALDGGATAAIEAMLTTAASDELAAARRNRRGAPAAAKQAEGTS